MGASLTLVTVMLKVSETVAVPSLAVTLTAIVPKSLLVGVPEKVRFEALKESQEGSEEPFESVAAYVSVVPLSISAKVLDGT